MMSSSSSSGSNYGSSSSGSNWGSSSSSYGSSGSSSWSGSSSSGSYGSSSGSGSSWSGSSSPSYGSGSSNWGNQGYNDCVQRMLLVLDISMMNIDHNISRMCCQLRWSPITLHPNCYQHQQWWLFRFWCHPHHHCCPQPGCPPLCSFRHQCLRRRYHQVHVGSQQPHRHQVFRAYTLQPHL